MRGIPFSTQNKWYLLYGTPGIYNFLKVMKNFNRIDQKDTIFTTGSFKKIPPLLLIMTATVEIIIINLKKGGIFLNDPVYVPLITYVWDGEYLGLSVPNMYQLVFIPSFQRVIGSVPFDYFYWL